MSNKDARRRGAAIAAEWVNGDEDGAVKLALDTFDSKVSWGVRSVLVAAVTISLVAGPSSAAHFAEGFSEAYQKPVDNGAPPDRPVGP